MVTNITSHTAGRSGEQFKRDGVTETRHADSHSVRQTTFQTFDVSDFNESPVNCDQAILRKFGEHPTESFVADSEVATDIYVCHR